MPKKSVETINKILFKGLPIVITVIGSFLLCYQYFFGWNTPLPIEPGIFSEMTKVPLDIFNWGAENYSLEVDNYLIFQNYEVLLPIAQTAKTICFGVLTWVLISLGISMISTFKRFYFIATMALVIFLLTLSGINSLNIGGISNNIALIILLVGTIVPAMVVHVFYNYLSLVKRTLIIAPVAILTMAALILSSNISEPMLMMAENISLMALAIAAIFILYVGHSLVSSFFLLLTRLNQGVGLKISWHLTIFTALYLLALFFLLLDMNGSLALPFPFPPLFPLFLLAGYLGYLEVQAKIRQINQPFTLPIIGQTIYWLGFGISTLVFWKADFSLNRPMMDFLDHWLVYTQLAFSLLFFAYLLANFAGFMNSGKPLAEVIFRPKFFAYYHMRIGGIIALLSVTVYADGIIAPQISTSSTNFSADYYYAIGKPLEARILFENSWQRYRRNEKAKVATILLYSNENQPTLARKNIEESLEWSPSEHEILLAANFAHKWDKYFDALFYLEKGLEIYPDNPFIKNNLALLYSKGNKAEAAYDMLDEIASQNNVPLANRIGLQAKHHYKIDENIAPQQNLVAKTNLMALKNLRGQFADFTLSTENVSNLTLHQAILRNQWTNKPNRPLNVDLQDLDSVSVQAMNPFTEQQLRTSRVVRLYQERQIGDALKFLNGLIFDFPNSAGYYHSLAAKILIGQGDMEKAALELVQAEERGFRNFKPQHLTVLYFGNQMDAAFETAEKYGLDFPEWMKVKIGSAGMDSEHSIFFRQLAQLNKAIKEDFLKGLDQLTEPNLKATLAHEILIKKGHWLSESEIGGLQNFLTNQEGIDQEYIQELCKTLTSEKTPTIASNSTLVKLLPNNSDLKANPYLTPFVLMSLDRETNNEKKYEILRSAADFNDDPLLWLEMIKYSKEIGMDEYGTEALEELSTWVDHKTLEKLELQPQ